MRRLRSSRGVPRSVPRSSRPRRLVAISANSETIDRAFLTLDADGVGLTVVQRSPASDRDFDERLIALDLEIARDERLDLIHLEALIFPDASVETIRSFARIGAGMYTRRFDRVDA